MLLPGKLFRLKIVFKLSPALLFLA